MLVFPAERGWQPQLCALCACTIALAGACDTDEPAREDVMVEGQAGQLHVDQGGEGGLPVVFVHSFGGNTTHFVEQLEHLRSARAAIGVDTSYFGEQIAQLSGSRKAIAIDLRGHGRSDAPPDNDYRAESLASDIEAAVDALILERFVLVGHSMGGTAAIAYAEANPDRVAGLMLVGTPGKAAPEMAEQVLASLEADYASGMDRYTQGLLQNATPAVTKQIRGELLRVPREESLAIIAAVFAYDPLPGLQSYPGPVLLVDTEHGEGPTALHAQLPALPREVIAGTSHWPHLDRPEAFDAILDRFLAQVEAAQPKK